MAEILEVDVPAPVVEGEETLPAPLPTVAEEEVEAPSQAAEEPVKKARAKGRPKGAADLKPRKPRAKPAPPPPPPPPSPPKEKKKSKKRPPPPSSDSEEETNEDDGETAYYKAMQIIQARANTAAMQKRDMYARWVGLR
jgi:hypothetical protein